MTSSGQGKGKRVVARSRAGAPAERRAPATATRGVRLPGGFAAIQRVARDTYQETKKVVWPDRETTTNLTLVVIGLSVFLGALLGGVDALFVRLWQLF